MRRVSMLWIGAGFAVAARLVATGSVAARLVAARFVAARLVAAGFIATAFVAMGIAAAGFPAAAQDAAAAAGREVAQRWCVNCHVIAPDQPQGSDQAPSFRAIARRPGTTAASLHAFLAIPHGKMPDQALSNADLDAVVAYILSMQR